MLSQLLRQLIASFGVVFRTIKAFFTRQIYTVVARVRSATNMTRQASKIGPKVLKTVTDASQKPTKREDYFEVGQLYIAKSLVVFLILGAIAVGVAFKFVAWPLLRSWFFTAKFWEEDNAVEGYNGRVILYYDKEKQQPHTKGRLKDGVLQGKAQQFDVDGLILYDGNFVDGLYDGDGVLYANGQKRYAGSFSAGKYEGEGRIYDNDQVVYEGGFSEGQYSGKGTLYEEGQLVYEGEFQAGQRSGIGKAYRNSKVIYEGGFAADLYDGTGSEYRMGKLHYKGDFRNGLFDGNGTEYYSDGSIRYRGGFVEGVYSGDGMLTLKDGTTIRGTFEDGETLGDAVCSKDKKIYYKGLLQSFMPHGVGEFLSAAGKTLFSGAASVGVPDGDSLLGMRSADVRELLGGTLDETMGPNGFVIRSRELGLAVYCSFAQDGAESEVYSVYLYPNGAQAPLDGLLWRDAASFERAARSCGLALPDVEQVVGDPALPDGVPVETDELLYAAAYKMGNGTLYLWSREQNGELLLAQWASAEAMPTVEGVQFVMPTASEEIEMLMDQLGLAKESAAAAAVKDPFCGNGDVADLLAAAKANGKTYEVLSAAIEYLRNAEERNAAEQDLILYQQMLDDESALLLRGKGSEERKTSLEQTVQELQLAQSRYEVQMRRQTLTVEEATGLQLSDYDLQALPLAFDTAGLDADALGRVLIQNAQKDTASQVLAEDGTQTVDKVDEKAILDQMELQLLDLKLAYQNIGLARDYYVTALDTRQKREQEYQIGNTDKSTWYQAQIDANDRRAALYGALMDFTAQAAALDERSHGWIAENYGWYADVLGQKN